MTKQENLIYDIKEYFKEAEKNHYSDHIINTDLAQMLDLYEDTIVSDIRKEIETELDDKLYEIVDDIECSIRDIVERSIH